MFQLRRELDGLPGCPGRVGIDTEHRLGMAPQLADNREVIGSSELDLVNGPAFELLHFGHHLLYRIDADGVVAGGQVVQFQSPQPPDGRAAQLAPKIVRCFIERAEGKTVVAEHRQQPVPKLPRVGERLPLNFGSGRFESRAHRLGSEFVEGVGGSAFSITSFPILLQLDEQIVLYGGGAVRDGESMAQGEVEVVELEFHWSILRGRTIFAKLTACGRPLFSVRNTACSSVYIPGGRAQTFRLSGVSR